MKKKSEFAELNAVLVSVFREEKEGAEGAKKAADASGFSPILLDTPAKATTAYSQKDFATYLIDEKGVIRAEIVGTKKKRPTGDQILTKAKEFFAKP